MAAQKHTDTATYPVPAEAPSLSPKRPYEPTLQERSAARRLRERGQQETPSPRFKVDNSAGGTTISADHPDPSWAYTLLADALATGDMTFAEGVVHQVANASRTGKQVTAHELNFMMAIIRGIAPRDATEALLAVQMAAVHNATMMAARRLNNIETIDQQDSASNMFNKLTRTFASQLEALKRYRSTGEQSVRVTHQHVNVTAAQAVVGINTRGGEVHENKSQPHEPGRIDEPSPSLLGEEQALGLPLPGAGSNGLERVPLSRCAGRGTEREG